MAKRFSILTHSNVACDYGHKSGRIPQRLSGRQMNCVEGTDRFYREWTSGVGKNRFSDSYDMTTPSELLQGEYCRTFLLNCDPSRNAGAKYCAAGFAHR